MRARQTFRPEVVQPLEDRVVLSRVGTALAIANLQPGRPPVQVGAATLRGAAVATSLGPVGALGDSYTDEYREYSKEARGHARNWVEILNATRGVNFGGFSSKSLGEPRNRGFSFVWARSDATSTEMVANQLPGLVAQVAQGKVRTAWVFVGGNDFLHVFRDLAAGRIAPASAPATLIQTETRLEANFTTAVNRLLAANPNARLVVSTLPDTGDLPATKLGVSLAPALKPLLDLSSGLIARYNALIRATAANNPRIALVDLAAATSALKSNVGTVPFGGQTIDLNTPGDDYHHFFLSDLIHVGTVAQGIIANSFINALNTRFGLNIRPLSQAEIIRFAQRVQSPQGRSIL
ncbi:MAG: GDSL-type esterase/lipase family protein [Isosphaeraceae bacterium]